MKYQSNFFYFFFLSLSLILGNKKKMAIDKRDNSYMLRLLSFSMFHRDHFLSFVCAPIVQQYLSLSSKRHRSSPIVIVLLFNSYRPMIIVIKVFSLFFYLSSYENRKRKEISYLKFSFYQEQFAILTKLSHSTRLDTFFCFFR